MQLLEELRRCGVQVEARGEVLHVEAPRGALSPELVRSLRRLKPALLRLVAREASRPVGEALGARVGDQRIAADCRGLRGALAGRQCGTNSRDETHVVKV